jgi:hypothetical protein
LLEMTARFSPYGRELIWKRHVLALDAGQHVNREKLAGMREVAPVNAALMLCGTASPTVTD